MFCNNEVDICSSEICVVTRLIKADILHRSISAMCYIYHCSHGTCNGYKSISRTSNFIFTVAMKVRVKPSVFVSNY